MKKNWKTFETVKASDESEEFISRRKHCRFCSFFVEKCMCISIHEVYCTFVLLIGACKLRSMWFDKPRFIWLVCIWIRMSGIQYTFDGVSFRFDTKRVQLCGSSYRFIMWRRTNSFNNVMPFKFFRKSNDFVTIMYVCHFRRTLCDELSLRFES